MIVSLTSKMLATTALIGIVTAATVGQAGQVVLYKDAPTAAELADMMFPTADEAPRFGKTRGIRFTDKADQELPEAAPVQATPKIAIPAPKAAAPATKVATTAPVAPVGGTAVGFNIRFAFNSADLLPETVVYLDRMGEMLAGEGNGRRVKIVGHTDASGDEIYNLQLSERRAQTVLGYLVANWRVDPKALTVAGLGEASPLPGLNPLDGANRRVEFHPVQ